MQTDPGDSSGRIRFGDFEVDVRSHELLRSGRRIRLQEKSFLVLNELLKSAGSVVTREALAAALWPKEYFVDVEHGLNTAVRRLREALGDSADEARYIETLPKLGYRFIGAIAADPASTAASVAPQLSPAGAVPPTPPTIPGDRLNAPVRWFRRVPFAAALIPVVLGLAIVATLVVRSRSNRSEPAPGTSDAVNELLARSRYLRNHKRYAEAKKFVEEALKLDPKNANALGGLALSLIGEGREGQARETARRALELDPNTFEAHRALGVLERSAGNFAAAERHFRRAVEADPADYKSQNRLARHLLECGRFDEAKELILETRRVAPDDPDVQNIWIEYALRTGDFEGAIRQGEIWIAIWQKQMQIEEQPLAGLRDTLGLAYVGARRHEEALGQFRAVDPDDDLRVALALGYAGRTGEARAILDAREKENSTPRADPGRDGAMAMAYITLGDFDRAFGHLDRQVAARWYPGWLNNALFQPIRQDSRWAAFALRLEREFLGREEGGSVPDGSVRFQIHQSLPRPVKDAPPDPSPR